MNETSRHYSNLVSVTATPTEIVLDFEMLTKERPKAENAEKVVSVVLNPGIAASLVAALDEAVKKHIKKMNDFRKQRKRAK